MITEIPLSRIVESPTNPRRTFDDASLAELAESIREKGVLSPVLVRPIGDGYELVFGHRRLRAARLALLPSIPAMVRELDDRAVLEVQVIENAQRSDVHPLEEADAYRALHEQHGLPIDELELRLGKSKAYVYSRLRLCSLPPSGRDAFLAGKFSASVALVIARMPTETQQVLAVEQLVQYADPTLADARRVTHGLMLRLADAPFDVAAVKLVPHAGACISCPKRSAAQRALFEDVSDDRCLDQACYHAKADAAWKRRADAARAEGWQVIDEDAGEDVYRQVFPYAPHHALAPTYVDLDAPAKHGSETTWREALGNPEPILARAPDGRAREIARRPMMQPSAPGVGPRGGTSEYAKQRAEWEQERTLREEIRRIAAPQLALAIAEQLGADVLTLRLLAADELVNASEASLEKLAEAAGVADPGEPEDLADQLLPHLRKVPGKVLAEFYASALIDRLWTIGWDSKTPRYTPAIAQACEDFGVDLKKAEAAAKRALKKKEAANAA